MVGRSDHCHFVPVDRVAAKEVLHLLSNLEGKEEGRGEGGREEGAEERKEEGKKGEKKGRKEGRKGLSEGIWTKSGVINFTYNLC